MQCKADDWEIGSVLRPHVAFDAILANAQQHELLPVALPETESSGPILNLSSYVSFFSLFPSGHKQASAIQDIKPIDRVILQAITLTHSCSSEKNCYSYVLNKD